MDNIKHMKTMLESAIYAEMNKGIDRANTDELGKAIDMLKDITETLYYCSIVKSMEDSETESKEYRKYYTPAMTPEIYRDVDRRTNGRMYYTETESTESDMMQKDNEMPMNGSKSDRYRTDYMKSKRSGDTSNRMVHLDNYAKMLTEDVMEMLRDATENEKTLIRSKMSALASKI